MVNDYHSASLRRGDQAIIHLRLLIDAAGLPTACSVQSTVGHGSFAEISCNHIIERARFEAALTVGLTAVRHSVQVPSFSHLRDLMRPRRRLGCFGSQRLARRYYRGGSCLALHWLPYDRAWNDGNRTLSIRIARCHSHPLIGGGHLRRHSRH